MRICCLPIAGPENPYQYLMMRGLQSHPSLEVRHGAPGKIFALLRTVWRFRPDAVHYDWIHRYYLRRYRLWTWLNAPFFVLEVWIVRRLLGVQLYWTVHNLSAHDRLTHGIDDWVRKRMLLSCRWIRVFHESTADRLVSKFGVDRSRMRVVAEGSYVGHYPDEIDREEARRRLQIPADRFVLLYLGLIRPYKGLGDLIEAFDDVAEQRWLLMLAGFAPDPNYADTVRAQCRGKDNVLTHLSFVPDTDLQTYFRAADVAVLPFRRIENSGSAILAMSFGLPVVAPNLGVLGERLVCQPDLLYDDGDLRGGLVRLRDLDLPTLTRIGCLNRDEVQKHRWEDFADCFLGEQGDEVPAEPGSFAAAEPLRGQGDSR